MQRVFDFSRTYLCQTVQRLDEVGSITQLLPPSRESFGLADNSHRLQYVTSHATTIQHNVVRCNVML